MSVLIGGGSGFVGRHLIQRLADKGMKVTVVSRTAGPNRITWSDLERSGLPGDYSAIVSLSGENILNPTKRWNDAFKKAVWSSRVDCTKALADAVRQSNNPPQVFVSMSGVGYYKPDPTAQYDEDSAGGDFDYLSELCTAWEAAANLPPSLNIRQVIVRSGVVLGRDGGMIQQIYWPFFMGVGGRIGSGQQWFPWIHVEDIAGIITHAITDDSVSGILNGVAPQPATNTDFTKAFASSMGRPALFPVPGFVMNTVYGPERGKVILEGQKVSPKRTLESGYKFAFPDLTSACKSLSQVCPKQAGARR